MISWFRQVDELLRGRKTAPERLVEAKLELPLRMFLPLAIVLGATYGFFMGWYAILSRDPASYMQLVASTVKLPALFLLTLVVTFPSLYVFNALVGCRLSFAATLRLLVGAIVVNVTVAASFGPILGFFTVSTASYSFMILLNVILLAIAGAVCLGFLLHTLRRLVRPALIVTPPLPKKDDSNGESDSEIERPERELGPMDHCSDDVPDEALGQARTIFRIWVIIYGLVGAQMGWLLRPFIGCPTMKFEWFRDRQGNFFEAVYLHLQNLFGVG